MTREVFTDASDAERSAGRHRERRNAARFTIREFAAADTDDAVGLWTRAGLTRPWNDPVRDVQRRLAIADGLFLVGTVDTAVVATAMGGYEGHRGWVNYLATEPERRGLGYARELMEELERRLLARGCPKINLQVRDDNAEALAFYERLGYSVDRSISLGKRLIADGPGKSWWQSPL